MDARFPMTARPAGSWRATCRNSAQPATWGRVNAEVAVDLPVMMHTTALQTTADYRIRAGFTVHF